MTDKPSYSTNVSAIHNLKAELFRKQEASKKKNNVAPTGSASTFSGYQVAKNNFLKTKASAKRKSSNDTGQAEVSTEALSEEGLSWEKAKIKLAEKEKLYDRLKQAHYTPEGDEDDQYLVDFGRRVQEDRNLSREAMQSSTSTNIKEDDDSSEDESGPYPRPSVPAEEWVEYEDYLGRSRKCLRKDLPGMLEENKKLAEDMGTRLESSGSTMGLMGATDIPPVPIALPAVVQSIAQPAGFDFGQTTGARLAGLTAKVQKNHRNFPGEVKIRTQSGLCSAFHLLCTRSPRNSSMEAGTRSRKDRYCVQPTAF